MADLGLRRATVVSTRDPAGKGRVQVKIPALFGETPTDWVEPHAPTDTLPPPGSTVFVLFQGEDASRMVYLARSATPDLSLYATNNAVVHLTGTEVISGSKTLNGVLSGTGMNRVSESIKAGFNVSGGGNIAVTSGAAVSWSSRFIVIANGNGTHFGTNGHFNINMPPDGTVITGAGGAGNLTVASGVIPSIGAYSALYYILPIGSVETSLPANFRVVAYGGALEIPDNWILLYVWNGDDNKHRFCNGAILGLGQTHQSNFTTGADAGAGIGSPRSLGTGSLQAAAGNDARLSDARTPTNDANIVHLSGTETVTGAKNFTGGLTAGGSAVVVTSDTRLSDARTPSNDSNIVHLTGSETITGAKTFNSITYFGASSTTAVQITGGANNHGLEIGRTDGSSSTPVMDFHSGATAVDYDTRIQSTGGTGASGGGTMDIKAGSLLWNTAPLATQTYVEDAKILALMGVL